MKKTQQNRPTKKKPQKNKQKPQPKHALEVFFFQITCHMFRHILSAECEHLLWIMQAHAHNQHIKLQQISQHHAHNNG